MPEQFASIALSPEQLAEMTGPVPPAAPIGMSPADEARLGIDRRSAPIAISPDDLARITGIQKATSIGPPQPQGPLERIARWLVGDPGPTSVAAEPFDLGHVLQKVQGIRPVEGIKPADPDTFWQLGIMPDAPKGSLEIIAQKFPRLANAIKAYHGSPHDYNAERLIRDASGVERYIEGTPNVLPDVPAGATVLKDFPLGRVRLEKLGTGEGAQAYGHGWYAAENQEVAKGYRDQLATPTVEIMGQQERVPSWGANLSPGPRLIRRLADARSVRPNAPEEDVINSVRQTLWGELANPHLDNASRNSIQDQLEILKAAEDRGLKTSSGGRMYEVAIHADPDQFLDWDKPLSQQSEAVQKFARRNLMVGEFGRYTDKKIQTGADLYHEMHAAREALWKRGLVKPPAGPEGASLMAKEAGIPGIKYLDQGSRPHFEAYQAERLKYQQLVEQSRAKVGADPTNQALRDELIRNRNELNRIERVGPGTHNYVVFDDKLIEIMKKYGVGLAVAQQIYQRQQQEQ